MSDCISYFRQIRKTNDLESPINCYFCPMEEWELDFYWLRVQHIVKERMQKAQLPDVNAILFLIGIQEVGFIKDSFTKEEKQDLMHVAVCRLLEGDGYYEFEGFDDDGWPHYRQTKPFVMKGVKQQEIYLKEKIIQYFELLEQQTGAFE